MKTLLLETATEKPLIAIADSGTVIAAKSLSGGPELSKTLALEVAQLLKDFHPERIAVGTGPGSYTGIRVGAALAQSLAFGWSLPLIGFCSLKAFLPPIDGPFATLFDARSGGIYALKGLKENGRYFFEEPLRIPLAQASTFLEGIPHLASPHTERLKEKLSLPALWFDTSPDPYFLAELVEQEPSQPPTLTYLSCPE